MINSVNLIPHDNKVCLKDIESRNKHKGAIVWLTGLSGSGKSTISIETQLKLFDLGCNVYILDGDRLRQGLNNDLNFSIEHRRENIRRAAQVANLFYDAGFIILCAFISPFADDRQMVRQLVPSGRFFEIYVKCSIQQCIKRDPKKLYEKAISNLLPDFTGISSPYEAPVAAELIVDTEKFSSSDSSDLIIKMLNDFNIFN